MERQHFKRALMMFAAIRAAMSLPMGQQQAALAAIGPYRSRGKGRGTPPRNFYGRCTQWYAHARADLRHDGRANARRRRQIAEGVITKSNGLECSSSIHTHGSKS